MNRKIIIRHGDVLLKQIDKIPASAKTLKDKVLAYGEATGHSHRFEDNSVVTRLSFDDKLYLQVGMPSTIIHEEHDSIIVPVGEYEQIQEREYDPFIESIRAVVD